MKSAFNGKIKVSVRKITAAFGSASGVAMDIAQYADRNWRFAWFILSPQEYSWFFIDRVYWKKQIKQQVIRAPDDSQDKNDDFKYSDHLKYSDREISLSESAWLKDNLMYSAQNLICKSLGNLASWQSALN